VAVVVAMGASGLGFGGCGDSSGPPMIEQIRLAEIYSDGQMTGLERTVFGFGTHPLASDADAHPVTSAKASSNQLRVIVNELMLGNNLEEIECRFVVDDDVYARVPVGATPDDIARCAVAQNKLASECPGSNERSVCLCRNEGGCQSGTTPSGMTIITPKGESVGIQDRDQDGAVDATRFVAGAAVLTCGAIDVPINLFASYWTPSGSQQKPTRGGFGALGPAIVVTPDGPLPTSQTCGLTFSEGVVDKAGTRLCAPPDGELARGCTPGDTSGFTFTVQPLDFTVESSVKDTGQSRTAAVRLIAAAPIDPVSLANLTVTESAATSYTQFSPALTTPVEITIQWTAPGGLAANTRYTISIPTTVTDTYHLGAPQPFQLAFTTGAL
jgi:hypothetical protein